MDASALKEKLLAVLDEAIDANKDQISGVGAEDFASYKYMLGVSHTLEDMKARVTEEFRKLYKEENV
jgi:hypothetical protein|tara:strand:- start:343 stop:543 length:201 start_codon:yes stop_codon:yes gene_type:complete